MRHQDYVVKLGAKERQWPGSASQDGQKFGADANKGADIATCGCQQSWLEVEGQTDCRSAGLLRSTMPARAQALRRRRARACGARKKRETPPVPPIFDGAPEAKLITLACSPPPAGHARWSLRLLENKVVELHIVDHASDNTIGRVLKKPT
jgi:hypothetical protein